MESLLRPLFGNWSLLQLFAIFTWSPGFLRRHSFVGQFKEAWQIV